jgi:hypothetical protein
MSSDWIRAIFARPFLGMAMSEITKTFAMLVFVYLGGHTASKQSAHATF